MHSDFGVLLGRGLAELPLMGSPVCAGCLHVRSRSNDFCLLPSTAPACVTLILRHPSKLTLGTLGFAK
eukprot:6303321-Amphidinium_carterae.1